MTTFAELSQALEAERTRRGLSTSDIASTAGVSRAGLYRFAAGGDIRLSTFLAIADSLGLDLVLAPKMLSASLQSTLHTGASHPTTQATLAPVGPLSAVEARVQEVQAKWRNTKGQA